LHAPVILRRAQALGDVVLATPLPRLLIERGLADAVFVDTMHPAVFEGNPWVSSGTPPESCAELTLDAVYESSPERHIQSAYWEAAQIPYSRPVRPELHPSAEHAAEASALLPPGVPTAVLHIEPTAWAGRNVARSTWFPVVSYLRRQGFRTVEVGRFPWLEGYVDECLVGKTAHPLVLASLLRGADLFVGIDGAPWHLSQAFDVPAVVAFGCINPAFRVTHPGVLAVQRPGLACLGCHHRLSAPRFDWGGCEREDVACMNLAPGDIISHIDRALACHSI
jgi:hypothetical protein